MCLHESDTIACTDTSQGEWIVEQIPRNAQGAKRELQWSRDDRNGWYGELQQREREYWRNEQCDPQCCCAQTAGKFPHRTQRAARGRVKIRFDDADNALQRWRAQKRGEQRRQKPTEHRACG